MQTCPGGIQRHRVNNLRCCLLIWNYCSLTQHVGSFNEKDGCSVLRTLACYSVQIFLSLYHPFRWTRWHLSKWHAIAFIAFLRMYLTLLLLLHLLCGVYAQTDPFEGDTTAIDFGNDATQVKKMIIWYLWYGNLIAGWSRNIFLIDNIDFEIFYFERNTSEFVDILQFCDNCWNIVCRACSTAGISPPWALIRSWP